MSKICDVIPRVATKRTVKQYLITDETQYLDSIGKNCIIVGDNDKSNNNNWIIAFT